MERRPKSIPCHVVKVDKDFIHVAFETANGIFTPPIVKIPQSMSQFQREPTQVGDKGYGVPGHYYLGGVTGDAGGGTDFYPRSNLTTLSFQPVSHTFSRDRDSDVHYQTGGPNGWSATAFTPMPQDNGQNQQGADASRTRSMNLQRSLTGASSMQVNPSSGSNGGSQQQQQQQPSDKTTLMFDNDHAVMQSQTDEYKFQSVGNVKATMEVPIGKWAFIGGPGDIGKDPKGKYAKIITEDGPAINSKARIG